MSYHKQVCDMIASYTIKNILFLEESTDMHQHIFQE